MLFKNTYTRDKGAMAVINLQFNKVICLENKT